MSEVKMLQNHGFEVVTAYNGEDAVEMVDSDPEISLILMDIDLGRGMDGTKAANIILEGHDFPIVFLTSHSEKEYVKRVKKISNYGYVLKNSGEFVITESIEMAYELFASKKRLVESEKRYKSLFQETPLGAFQYNLNGTITDCNQQFADIIGSSMETLCGLCMLSDLNNKELIEEVRESLCGGVGLYTGDYTSVTANKTTTVRVFLKGMRNDDGEIYSGLGLVEDITDRTQAEEALSEKTRLLQNITDNMFDLIAVTDLQGNFTFIGKSHSIFGYELQSLVGRNVLDFVHPADLPRVKTTFTSFIARQEDKRKVEYRYRCADGSYIWLETVGKIMKNEAGKPAELLFSSRDISDQKFHEKALEERESRYKALFNNSAVSLWEEDITQVRSDLEGLKHAGVKDFNQYFIEHPETMEDLIGKIEIVDVNVATVKLYGADTKEHLLGRLDKTLYPSDDSLQLIRKELIAMAENRPYVEGEMKTKKLDGKVLNIMVRINLFYEQGQENTMLVAISDITQLRKAIREKDELMRELNHRVKNNLVMVGSLIQLKNSELGDTADLSDILHQVDAIRLIHERFYRNEEITQVPVQDYLADLATTVFAAFTAQHVSIDCQIEDISLRSGQAISVGLILNEIATNAIKHGFSTDEAARFIVEMQKDPLGECYILTISNTGKPFPADVSLEKPESLGLQIISTLVKQIDGTIELRKTPNPKFTIRFPREAE